MLPNGVERLGWVALEEDWAASPGKASVGTGTRYLTSTFYVLNALEHGGTAAEMGYALFAELMRDFILGLVAGLMATIAMALNQVTSGLM